LNQGRLPKKKMGQRQAKPTDLADNLRETVGDLNLMSNPFEYAEGSESLESLVNAYLEKSLKVLSLRKKLLQSASSVDRNTKFRRLLFEAAVAAQQILELTKRLDTYYDVYYEKPVREKMRDELQKLYMELTEQLGDTLELLTTADGLRIRYLLRFLASSKTFTKLASAAELVWLKQVSRSAAVSNIIICGKYPYIEAESHTGILDERPMFSSDLIRALEAVRPAILPMCRNRAHQHTPLLQVGRAWYILCV
jgi:hypothetical protein